MAEGGSDYCSEKSDDFCGNASGEVKIHSLTIPIQSLGSFFAYRSDRSGITLLRLVCLRCFIIPSGFLLSYVKFLCNRVKFECVKSMVYGYVC